MANPELAVVGLVCNVVGVFFLANSIRFREPRKAIEENLGVAAKSLDRVRDTALNNMQVMNGFLFLTAGFLLQIMGQWDAVSGHISTLGLCAGIVAFAGLTYAVGAVYSRRTFRKLLREFFQQHQWSFTENMTVTKEIGEFLGVPHSEDATVETYVRQVRQALGVTAPVAKPERTADRSRRIRDISPLPGR
jgi:hypothetical protein